MFAYTCCPPSLRPVFERLENSPIGYRFAKGTIWSMAGTIISRSLMALASIVVARLLGKTGYGELGMIKSTVGMFGVFAGFGLGLTATKHVAEFRSRDPERAGRIIGLSSLVAMVTGGLMAVGLFILAPWLAEHTIKAPQLTEVLRVGVLILLFNALNAAQTGALSGFEAFKAVAYINVLVGLVSFPLVVLGSWYGGVLGTVWALAITLWINWLINIFVLRREAQRYNVFIRFNECRRELSILWRFSTPAVLSGAVVGPAVWVCNAMLVNRPGGYGEMGIFAAGLVFQHLLITCGGMLDGPLLSMISSIGPNISERLGTVNILSSWIVGAIAAIPLVCFPEITHMLFGADYDKRGFTVTFSIVVFYTCIMMFKSGLARVLAANNLLWYGFFSNAFWGLTLIGCAFFFVRWGAVGLATSFAIAYALNCLILIPLYYSRKLIPRRTLLSVESALIWSVLIVLVLLNVADVQLYFRIIAFVVGLPLTAMCFIRLMK